MLDVPAINAVKAKLGVPITLWSCHTAEIDGSVIEGHVPAAAIARLLTEHPKARGIAVPGMPVGSPGIEVVGREPQAFNVMLCGEGDPSVFMTSKAITLFDVTASRVLSNAVIEAFARQLLGEQRQRFVETPKRPSVSKNMTPSFSKASTSLSSVSF